MRETRVVSVSCKFPPPVIQFIPILENIRVLHHHRCVSNVHRGSVCQSADTHHRLDLLLLTPFLFKYYSCVPFWWALLQCRHHCQARMGCCCTLNFTSCVALMPTNMPDIWSLAKQIAVLFTAVVWDGCRWAASASRLDDANGLLMIVV